MPYSRIWSKNNPPGSQVANTIDDEIRTLREDVEQRMSDLVTGWDTVVPTDPIVLKPKAHARAFLSVNQSLSHAASTAIVFDSENFDTNSLHAPNSSRLTIPTGLGIGVWVLHGHIAFDANSAGAREARIKKNGVLDLANHITTPVGGGEGTGVDVLTIVSNPIVGDYFEVYGRQTSGGALSVLASTILTYFEAWRVL